MTGRMRLACDYILRHDAISISTGVAKVATPLKPVELDARIRKEGGLRAAGFIQFASNLSERLLVFTERMDNLEYWKTSQYSEAVE